MGFTCVPQDPQVLVFNRWPFLGYLQEGGAEPALGCREKAVCGILSVLLPDSGPCAVSGFGQ